MTGTETDERHELLTRAWEGEILGRPDGGAPIAAFGDRHRARSGR